MEKEDESKATPEEEGLAKTAGIDDNAREKYDEMAEQSHEQRNKEGKVV